MLFDRAPGALDEIALLTARGQTLITGADRVARGRDDIVALQQPLSFSGPAARCRQSTTNSIWCRLANMCLSPALLNRIGITKLTAGQEGFHAGDGPHMYQVAGRAAR